MPCRFLIAFLAVASLLTLTSDASAIRLRAHQAGVYDMTTGKWIYEKSLDKPAPIASITKVVAALTFVRLTDDLDQMVTITREDWRGAGRTRLRIGDRVPARTLLKLALVASDNCAARALAHPFALSQPAFGYLMQETAWGLGCRRSYFMDPSGLDPKNVATVREVVLLFRKALEHPELREIMGLNRFTLSTRRGRRTVVHSSRLLRYRRDVTAAKTGYLAAAGYCMVQYVETKDGAFITVLLGAPTKGARTRESARLIDHGRQKRIKLLAAARVLKAPPHPSSSTAPAQ
jgi:D-alanyl-D-alanine endopeptidase (penicillin-binding protein 7)